nr:hypothetical protein GCM10020093_043530 [Planobispora longispora]
MFDADLTGLAPDREVTLWYLQNETFSGVIITGTGAAPTCWASTTTPPAARARRTSPTSAASSWYGAPPAAPAWR